MLIFRVTESSTQLLLRKILDLLYLKMLGFLSKGGWQVCVPRPPAIVGAAFQTVVFLMGREAVRLGAKASCEQLGLAGRDGHFAWKSGGDPGNTRGGALSQGVSSVECPRPFVRSRRKLLQHRSCLSCPSSFFSPSCYQTEVLRTTSETSGVQGFVLCVSLVTATWWLVCDSTCALPFHRNNVRVLKFRS